MHIYTQYNKVELVNKNAERNKK